MDIVVGVIVCPVRSASRLCDAPGSSLPLLSWWRECAPVMDHGFGAVTRPLGVVPWPG